MKPILGPSLLFAATVLLFAGCDPEERAQGGRTQPKPTHGGFTTPAPRRDVRPVETTENTTEETVPRERRERAPQAPDPEPTKPAPTATATTGAPEYAKPVPGKPGFVTSPYKPYDGLVDVRGFAPGTELQDPYEKGRTFLVPAQ